MELAPSAVMMDGMSSAERVKTIGLCMIVKNEAHVILRCLASVRPLVDYVLIEDTGSTDGTQQLVMDWLSREGVPGEIVEEAWRDFAYNRSHALAKLREFEFIDYSLIIDADDVLVIDPSVNVEDLKKNLSSDSYSIDIRHGPIVHQRTQICSNQKRFLFRGVIHEFLDCQAETATAGSLSGISLSIIGGGARGNDADKYRRDAELIEKALSSETDAFLRSRYTFYLAQSYHDCGERQKSLETYLQRAEMGFWNEEVYVSLLNAARLKEALNYPFDDIIGTYQRATDTVPTRAEAIHGASRYCRMLGRNREGYAIGKTGIDLPMPSGLFVEGWIYDYGLLDEFAINAYWAGQYAESLSASLRVLGQDKISASDRERTLKNAEFASRQLIQIGNSGPDAKDYCVNQNALVPAAIEQLSSLRQTFQTIYQEHRWGCGSGPGSSPANTIEYRAFIERFVEANHIRSVTDLGCGDWTFSHLIDWSHVEYLGLDIVPEIVAQNRSRFASINRRFEEFTVIDDLPGGDLLVSKEVLQHLPNQIIAEYISTIRQKYRFALLTNSIEPLARVNVDIPEGGYRPVRLQDAPFNAPGAIVFSYFPHSGNMFWKNATFLMLGAAR